MSFGNALYLQLRVSMLTPTPPLFSSLSFALCEVLVRPNLGATEHAAFQGVNYSSKKFFLKHLDFDETFRVYVYLCAEL